MKTTSNKEKGAGQPFRAGPSDHLAIMILTRMRQITTICNRSRRWLLPIVLLLFGFAGRTTLPALSF
jgi:hypothetical protein